LSIRKLKFFFILILLFFGLTSFAQSDSEAFWKIRRERLSNDSIWWTNAKKALENSDSSKKKVFVYPDSLRRKNEKLLTKLIGCQFPDATLLLENDIALSTIYNDFTILNFHNNDHDTLQLQNLARLKKESCESLTIIAFFAEPKEDIQNLIDKYKDEIVFIPDAKFYIVEHSFNMGIPMIWVLNKEKLIKCVKSGYYKEKDRLFYELKNEMNYFSDSYR
jgi:hypothetical protein